jgi:putative addiction module component (TIGR02574 family)
MTRIELERKVLELPEEERLEVAEAIWASLDDPDAVPLPYWQRELLAERLAESETEEGRDWEEIRSEIWPDAK